MRREVEEILYMKKILYILTFLFTIMIVSCGDSDSTFSNPNTAPTAVIRCDRMQGPATLVVHFDASASSDLENNITDWQWDFGDGDYGESETLVRSFPLPGTYTIMLTVTDAGSLLDTDTVSIVVDNPASPEPPPQLNWGPGGSDYEYRSINENSYDTGNYRYWLFEPTDPTPFATLPVVVFNHGWGIMEPDSYIDWIHHIVKRGTIIIFPVYQESLLTTPEAFTSNAIVAIKNAIAELQNGSGHVTPDLGKVAMVGYSYGGVISANIASLSPSDPDLPEFLAVQCTEPGTKGFNTYEDYSLILSDTLLLCIAGEDDAFVGDIDAKIIFNEATAINNDNKNFITIVSDNYSSPELIADHFAPTEDNDTTNSLDWFGFWKWFDGLCDVAFYNKNRKYALGNTPEQRFMGYWSDGTPVNEAIVTDNP